MISRNFYPSNVDLWSACPSSAEFKRKKKDKPSPTVTFTQQAMVSYLTLDNYIVADKDLQFSFSYLKEFIDQRKGSCNVHVDVTIDYPKEFFNGLKQEFKATEQIDVFFGNENDVYLIDFKTGEGSFEVSKQMHLEAILICEGLDYINDQTTIHMVIVKPLSYEGKEKEVKAKWGDIKTLKLFFIATFQKAFGGNPEHIMDDHCKKCPRLTSCGAVAELFHFLLSSKEKGVGMKTDYYTICMYGSIIKKYIEEGKAEAQAKLEAGEEIEGLYLKSRKGSRYIPHDLEAEMRKNILGEQTGQPLTEKELEKIYTISLKSISQLKSEGIDADFYCEVGSTKKTIGVRKDVNN